MFLLTKKKLFKQIDSEGLNAVVSQYGLETMLKKRVLIRIDDSNMFYISRDEDRCDYYNKSGEYVGTRPKMMNNKKINYKINPFTNKWHLLYTVKETKINTSLSSYKIEPIMTWGVVDADGNEVLPFGEYKNIQCEENYAIFSSDTTIETHDNAVILSYDGKIISKDYKHVILIEYDKPYLLARKKVGNKFVEGVIVINKNNEIEEKIPLDYDKIKYAPTDNESAFTCLKNGKTTHINITTDMEEKFLY